MVSGLEALPTELQYQVFRLLDPVGLINASQTCSGFRRVINPQRIHFVERLLVLECNPEIGGPPYGYEFYCENGPFPPPREPFGSPLWDTRRMACPGCLRLRSHLHFTFQHLFRLRYRKPAPNTPAADIPSSWEPSLRGKSWGRQYQREQRHRGLGARDILAGKQYHALAGLCEDSHEPSSALQALQDSHVPEFEGMTLEQFEQADYRWLEEITKEGIAEIERHWCGYERRLRRCIDCMFRHGKAHKAKARSFHWNGTEDVPVVQVRNSNFRFPSIRWFPVLLFDKVVDTDLAGYSPRMRFEHPVLKRGRWTDDTPLFMILCPGCKRWQEMRAFRVFPIVFGEDGPERFERGTISSFQALCDGPARFFKPESFACNACLAKSKGREALGLELASALRLLLSAELLYSQRLLQESLTEEKRREAARSVMPGAEEFDPWESKWWEDLTRDQVRRLMAELKVLWRQRIQALIEHKVIEEKNRANVMDSHDKRTHVREQAWFWLADRWEEAGCNSMNGPDGRLVRWALGESEP